MNLIYLNNHFKYTKLYWTFFIQWKFQLEPKLGFNMSGHVEWTWGWLWDINIYELIRMRYSQRKKNVLFWCLQLDARILVVFSGKQHWDEVGRPNSLLGKHPWKIKARIVLSRESLQIWQSGPTYQGALEQRLSVRLSPLLNRNILLGLPRYTMVSTWKLRWILNTLQLETQQTAFLAGKIKILS